MSEEEKKPRKLSLLEKAASYPARVAILGGLAAGEAGDQFLYNRGMRSPKFSEDTKQGKGYEKAKKLGRMAVGIDAIDEDEKKMKKGGSVKSSASRRADGCVSKGKTKGRMI